MRRKELLAIIVLTAISILVIGFQLLKEVPENRTLIIEVDNNTVLERPLLTSDTDKFNVQLKSGEATVVINEGKVEVIENGNHSCPKGICYTMGPIEKPGQSIVCLPNKMVITIIN